jgi:hypothetical protein
MTAARHLGRWKPLTLAKNVESGLLPIHRPTLFKCLDLLGIAAGELLHPLLTRCLVIPATLTRRLLPSLADDRFDRDRLACASQQELKTRLSEYGIGPRTT